MRAACLLLIACSTGSDPFEGSAAAPRKGPPPAIVTVDAPPATAGVATTATVTVTAPAGFHINSEYPVALHLDATPGVALAKQELTRADAQLDEHQLRMPIALTPDGGSHAIRGRIAYAYCRQDECVPRNTDVTITIAAK